MPAPAILASTLLPFGNRLAAVTTYLSGYSLSSAGRDPRLHSRGLDESADQRRVRPVPGGLPRRLNVDATDHGSPDAGLVGEQLIELPLEATFPGIPPWDVFVRYQANINFLALAESLATPLITPLSYLVVTQSPPWSSSTFVVTRLLRGVAGAPPDAVAGACLDSPNSVEENISGSWWYNAGAAGLYANWTTLLSQPGWQDETVQAFSYTTSCKRIGGAVADADNDCWSDASDTNDADRDQDDDGLLDGMEAAWVNASCVADADCDNDGRTDAEEMVGPGQFLTNPVSSDTDSDGFLDAGYHLDCDGDGAPDMPLEDMNAGTGTGRNRVSFGIVSCKPDGSSTNSSACSYPAVLVSCGGRPFGNVGAASADSCPNNDDATQANSANTLLDLDSLPIVGDTNGRFNGIADNTHPDGRFSGDACEMDADNDGVNSAAENGSLWWDFTGGASFEVFCNDVGLGVPIALDATNRDSDGDGTVDGAECKLETNPADPGSKPGVLAPDEQTFYRLI